MTNNNPQVFKENLQTLERTKDSQVSCAFALQLKTLTTMYFIVILPMKKNGVGRDYNILSAFRNELKFSLTYFAPQIRLGIRLMLIRLDSASPPQGICAPYPAHHRIIRKFLLHQQEVTHRKEQRTLSKDYPRSRNSIGTSTEIKRFEPQSQN